jgi:hypothetical protein
VVLNCGLRPEPSHEAGERGPRIGDAKASFDTIPGLRFACPGYARWTKSATSSGGAICTANITYANASTYDWQVEFTIK